MILRRQTICSILSALLLAGCSTFQASAPERVVRVKALVDPPFRTRNSGWDQEARGLIEAASDYYEEEFGIRLTTHSVSPWPEEERVPSTPALLARLQKQFPVASADGSYDIVIAFTGENVSRILTAGRPRVDRIGNCSQGLARYVVLPTRKLFRYTGQTANLDPDVITLVHEIGHVFGAEHVEDVNSIMNENFDYRSQFDAKNRTIIQNNRSCPFAK
jgi:Metallo-peptidase family M12